MKALTVGCLVSYALVAGCGETSARAPSADPTDTQDDSGSGADAGSDADAASADGPEPAFPDQPDAQPSQPSSGPCTGKPGSKRGKQKGMVTVGELNRTFIYYAPENLDPDQPAPVVISPHGFTMTGQDMFAQTGFKELADEEGFVAFFPDGNGATPWNVGQGINGVGAAVGAPGTQDDQGFIDAMVRYAEEDQCLDKNHMFVAGFSMGGYFSNEVACVRNDFAGVGPHSGGTHDLTKCPGSIKPVIIFHGDTDYLIYYEVGVESRDRWVARNGCSTEFDAVEVKGGTCEYYKDCAPNGQVAFCSFKGMLHEWAGDAIWEQTGTAGPSLFFSPPDTYDNAARMAWAFWKQYAW